MIPPAPRPAIYQLFVRLFGNANERRKPDGTLAENGCGRFADVTDAALRALADAGFTHVWLHGVLRQATATDHSAVGLPPDDPRLTKGLAGSPYAVRDVFDVCPDYAVDPARRLDEFRELVARVHARGMRAIVDFVPNHVARSHRSVVRPDLDLGAGDDPMRPFAPSNNFLWLEGTGPLRLPAARDGVFAPEAVHGRVTGNNAATWEPSASDWYETVKLNYGHDFRTGRGGPREYPTDADPGKPVPDTWRKMDAVLAHWQGLGVDGFRCDMAHWIPMEFWRWAIARARSRDAGAFFLAEAYDDDPNKVVEGNVCAALVAAGFDAVYDHHAYRMLKGVYDGPKWANDLDDVLGAVAPLHAAARYAENHDEVRLAAAGHWGGVGAAVGRPVTAVLFGIGRGPVLLYNGQEVGEPASGAEGFGGDDGRTTIFDYWSMPELAKWTNGGRHDGGRLSPGQRALRAWYARLVRLTAEPAFARGEFFPLNGANIRNPAYGRLPGESASGHWLYSHARWVSGAPAFVVVANLHPTAAFEGVRVRLTPGVLAALGAGEGTRTVVLRDRLEPESPVGIRVGASELRESGLPLPRLGPLAAWYLEAIPDAA